MQYLHDANKAGDPERQSQTGQATQFIEGLRELLAKVAPHPPAEVLQLISRLNSAPSKDKSQLIPNPVVFHRMISVLHRNPDSTMGALSQALSVPLYTATRMVDSLVATGLAQRLSDPEDRRIVRVALTDDGLRFHEAIEAHFAQKIQRIMACLTPEEQGILIALLHKVATSLKETET